MSNTRYCSWGDCEAEATTYYESVPEKKIILLCGDHMEMFEMGLQYGLQGINPETGSVDDLEEEDEEEDEEREYWLMQSTADPTQFWSDDKQQWVGLHDGATSWYASDVGNQRGPAGQPFKWIRYENL